MEKKSFSKRLYDYLMCGHKELLFMGGTKTSQSKVDTYVYMCKNCGKVIKSSYRLDFPDVHVSTLSVLGKLEFTYRGKVTGESKKYDINNFYRHMVDSKIEYSREQLKVDFDYLEGIISSLYKSNLNLLHNLQKSENVVIELRKQNELLSSVADNKDNVIYNEKQLSILDNNEMQLHNSGMLKEWLMSLLLERKVIIPKQAFKLFKTMLTAIYGYETMRNKWEFEDKSIEGIDYVVFYNREKRRIKR